MLSQAITSVYFCFVLVLSNLGMEAWILDVCPDGDGYWVCLSVLAGLNGSGPGSKGAFWVLGGRMDG